MSSSFAACTSFAVIAMSSGLGVGSFEGWLWTMMTWGTASTTAGRSTSAGLTMAEYAFPW